MAVWLSLVLSMPDAYFGKSGRKFSMYLPSLSLHLPRDLLMVFKCAPAYRTCCACHPLLLLHCLKKPFHFPSMILPFFPTPAPTFPPAGISWSNLHVLWHYRGSLLGLLQSGVASWTSPPCWASCTNSSGRRRQRRRSWRLWGWRTRSRKASSWCLSWGPNSPAWERNWPMERVRADRVMLCCCISSSHLLLLLCPVDELLKAAGIGADGWVHCEQFAKAVTQHSSARHWYLQHQHGFLFLSCDISISSFPPVFSWPGFFYQLAV